MTAELKRIVAAGVLAVLLTSVAGGAASTASVLPHTHHSKIALEDSIVKLVRAGALEPAKLAQVYASRGGIPADPKAVLDGPSHDAIVLTKENAGLYVNLLWGVGLANHMAINDESRLNDGPWRSRYASTSGWTLGREATGGGYFNRFPIVELSAQQEARVARVARNTFRPCCDNSTFFQDCNHGSALLGLLALGAAQGLSESELYAEALAFNSFWFPQQYTATAHYFAQLRNTAWQNVDVREVMSARYSSASGWRANVATALAAQGLLPRESGGDCAV